MKFRFVSPLLISLAFFFIPFFWLKPGEMDLGGDSSRLYFYDPLNYLIRQALYSISPAAFGGENFSFFSGPFFLLLIFLKSIVHSPTILISAFHGFSLSVAFLSCYLIVKEFLSQEKETTQIKKNIVEVSSIISGVFYNLSPVPIAQWIHVLITYNQVFLNPLMFYLLLRFFLSGNMAYMLVAFLVSFIFAPNFSFIAAPPIFAFYPLGLLFLTTYTVFIRKKSLPVRKIILGLLLFLFLHAFHLVPTLLSIFFSPTSVENKTIFSQGAIVDRGLGYFTSIAPSVKVYINLLALPQLTKLSEYSWIFFVFPILLILGFMWNKTKVYLLTGIFFLIVLFFDSANITKIGFTFYVSLFQIPGFSMFRNFIGQFMWAYIFFYTLLFGQAVAIVLGKLNKQWYQYILISFLSILFITTSWQFINGNLTNPPLWQSKDIRSHIEMDPEYEKVLFSIRALPVDGKVLTLPLSDPALQILQGKNGGAYMGPSTITYLTNKSEFIGYDEIESFGPVFATAARKKNFTALKNILAILNIKYIFYNSDPYIYEENFPAFPYEHVLKYLPATQDEYKTFIDNLDVEKIADFGGKYHLYTIKDANYLPHIYVAKKAVYINGENSIDDLLMPLTLSEERDKRLALFADKKILRENKNLVNEIFLIDTINNSNDSLFRDTNTLMPISTSVPIELYSLFHPLLVLNEKNNIGNPDKSHLYYLNQQILNALKIDMQLENKDKSLSSPYIYNFEALFKSPYFQIYIEKDQNIEVNKKLPTKIIVNDKDEFSINNQFSANWLKLDYYNSSQQNNSLHLSVIQTGDVPLDILNWKSFLNKQTIKSIDFSIDKIMLEMISNVMRRYVDWASDSIYLMSFDYRIKDQVNAAAWNNQKLIIETGMEIKPVYMKVFFENSYNQIDNFATAKDIDIKNFSVIHLTYPKVVLQQENNLQRKQKQTPKITFTKINPTKYEIKISHATNPYTLVFLGAYNKSWKLYDTNKQSNSFFDKIIKTLSIVGRTIVGIFVKEKTESENNIQASYFNGEIKEGIHGSTFLIPKTFDTWGKQSVANQKHFLVNGYANAWVIEPKDMDGKTDYTLFLELETQRMFSGFLLISSITFITCIALLLKAIKFRNEK